MTLFQFHLHLILRGINELTRMLQDLASHLMAGHEDTLMRANYRTYLLTRYSEPWNFEQQ
jgi:hypothetical protein